VRWIPLVGPRVKVLSRACSPRDGSAHLHGRRGRRRRAGSPTGIVRRCPTKPPFLESKLPRGSGDSPISRPPRPSRRSRGLRSRLPIRAPLSAIPLESSLLGSRIATGLAFGFAVVSALPSHNVDVMFAPFGNSRPGELGFPSYLGSVAWHWRPAWSPA